MELGVLSWKERRLEVVLGQMVDINEDGSMDLVGSNKNTTIVQVFSVATEIGETTRKMGSSITLDSRKDVTLSNSRQVLALLLYCSKTDRRMSFPST
jgi:hypothetical protein